MKSISVFNNKGGVGKTTLTYHVGHALSEMGFKVLMIDADPQCNLTIYSLNQESIHSIWEKEDKFIDAGFESSKNSLVLDDFRNLINEPRSLHFILKPTEEGTGDLESLPPPVKLSSSLDIIPGRLTLHLYEDKIAERWAGIYRGDPLAIRTVTKIREISEKYSTQYGYDYVIIDTSPSLGSLNKVVISTVDGFFVPAAPDLFSLYGIRNIGKSLSAWKAEFNIIYQLISEEKRHSFPKDFVSFLGYTIYNAKKYSGVNNTWNLAHAHFNYANRIPETIKRCIEKGLRSHLDDATMSAPIGETSVMHSHNTFPTMAQHYHTPMWRIPSLPEIETEHASTIRGASAKYQETGAAYRQFCESMLKRIELLDA
ncbi:AAA family ATPase [Janthinobacterium sp. 17J80-10]|uniref:ParA family protein n=1 Tax=Janthinobacterium sp. 17J80-10 TaxID=2497863 RepID=UPI0010056B8A|nr:AAA family ATPase [Janthinobacterium sp. 17J80-10]QAU34906.1 ParA family protein [Janthinobacterium sp. 17J80-10]